MFAAKTAPVVLLVAFMFLHAALATLNLRPTLFEKGFCSHEYPGGQLVVFNAWLTHGTAHSWKQNAIVFPGAWGRVSGWVPGQSEQVAPFAPPGANVPTGHGVVSTRQAGAARILPVVLDMASGVLHLGVATLNSRPRTGSMATKAHDTPMGQFVAFRLGFVQLTPHSRKHIVAAVAPLPGVCGKLAGHGLHSASALAEAANVPLGQSVQVVSLSLNLPARQLPTRHIPDVVFVSESQATARHVDMPSIGSQGTQPSFTVPVSVVV